jgi:hypothetical protein
VNVRLPRRTGAALNLRSDRRQHKGRTRAVCSDLALRIQRVCEVGPSGYMDPAVLDEDRTAALRAGSATGTSGLCA